MPRSSAAGAAPTRDAAPRILVLMRDELERARVRAELASFGYAVHCAGHGPEASWCAETLQLPPALLVTDLHGWEHDGFHPGVPLHFLWQRMPVLTLDRLSHSESVRRGLLHPSAPYLQRPVGPRRLRHAVGALIRRELRRAPIM